MTEGARRKGEELVYPAAESRKPRPPRAHLVQVEYNCGFGSLPVQDRQLYLGRTEPRRVYRRRWIVSHAAISMLSAAASYRYSASASGMMPKCSSRSEEHTSAL